MIRMTLKEFLMHSKESRRVLSKQASRQASKQACRHAGKQAGKQTRKQTSKQASTKRAFSRCHALEGLALLCIALIPNFRDFATLNQKLSI